MYPSILFVCLLLGTALCSSSRRSRGFSLELSHDKSTVTSRKAIQGASGPTNPVLVTRYDVSYYAKISVGTPPRELRLVLDTGSIDNWGISNQFPRASRKGLHYWTPRKSRTSSIIDDFKWSARYYDGSSVSGTAWKDTLSFGDATITSAGFAAATGTPSYIYGPPIDGFIGLANQNTQASGAPSLMASLSEQILPANLFAMSLKHATTGTIDFGFVDDSKYTGDMHYTALQHVNPTTKESTQWYIYSTSFTIGDVSYDIRIDNWFVDSGTTLLYAPSYLHDNYYAMVPSAQYSSDFGGMIFQCNESLPDLTLAFPDAQASGNVFEVTIPGKQLVYRKLNSTYCYGGLLKGGTYLILGDMFMKGLYVVFDHDNSRLGLAPQSS